MAAVLLTGCGGGRGDSKAEPKANARSAEAVAKTAVTVEAVRDGLVAAVKAAGVGQPEFLAHSTDRDSTCVVKATVPTSTTPDTKAVKRVIAKLKMRGWPEEGRAVQSGRDIWLLSKESWTASLAIGA
ncbi:hypothetical protein [Streptomyces cadmiisoli]|uniref:hypothetical protein n=1 Tax=Streptomyces cadmiisoli TaxID=2184053 RepID=UPI0013A6ADED|nr:hypothetical protein [Streptomyces cadmiisoli]